MVTLIGLQIGGWWSPGQVCSSGRSAGVHLISLSLIRFWNPETKNKTDKLFADGQSILKEEDIFRNFFRFCVLRVHLGIQWKPVVFLKNTKPPQVSVKTVLQIDLSLFFLNNSWSFVWNPLFIKLNNIYKMSYSVVRKNREVNCSWSCIKPWLPCSLKHSQWTSELINGSWLFTLHFAQVWSTASSEEKRPPT